MIRRFEPGAFAAAEERCYRHFMQASWENGAGWAEAISRLVRAYRARARNL